MKEARLGDVAESMKNGIYKPANEYGDDGIPCLRMYNIDAGAIVWRDIKRMRVTDAERVDYGLLEGDLLVNRVNSRELVGKAAVIPFGMEPSVFESKNIRLRLNPEKARAKYINYQLLAGGRRHFAGNAQQVVGMASISQTQLADFPIVLDSLARQDEIVAELDKQFSRLDEAVANLQRVKANLKRYKASVLKDAVEGRLVPTEAELARREGRGFETGEQLLRRILVMRRKGWTGKRNYREPVEPETADMPGLPMGWTWVSPDQLSASEPYSLAIGPFGSSLKVSDYTTEGVPLVFVRNIRAVLFGGPETVFVTPDKAEELKAHIVEAGDILVTKMGAPPGDVCMYPVTRPPAVITADCIKLRLLREQLSAAFVAYAIESKLVQSQIQGITKGVAQLKVSLGNFSSLGFPLPPVAEQLRIVEEIDRRLSIVRSVETEVDAKFERAQSLRNAVLTKSFRRSY